jgi:dTDP-4-dehydrorhamnose 3,5-epimerase
MYTDGHCLLDPNFMKKDFSQGEPRIFVPKRFSDNRGWFSETFRETSLQEFGVVSRYVQENESFSRHKGTVRGLHFQTPPYEQAKLVFVPCGRILDIIVDVRKDSPTYGQHVSVELSAETGNRFYVPVGFAHGFVTLEDSVTVLYKVSNYYQPACDGGIRWNDPDLGIAWPVKPQNAVLSEKDRNLPLLKDFVSPFSYNGKPLVSLTPIGQRAQ